MNYYNFTNIQFQNIQFPNIFIFVFASINRYNGVNYVGNYNSRNPFNLSIKSDITSKNIRLHLPSYRRVNTTSISKLMNTLSTDKI